MPPVGDITENTDDDWRSKARPIDLIVNVRRQVFWSQ